MRKGISFVLVLALVLGSFSMAFAAQTTNLSDVDKSPNKEAITVSYDLGIITGNPDGTYMPEKAVNRAEFAALITRAMAIPDSALSGFNKTKFKDTSGYSWAVPYIAFCESKGIMIGDGKGNAMPGRTINTNEAVTMILRAIGYTNNSSELVGVWPTNYVTKGQALGIYENVANVANVDKQNAAQIVYNGLTVQLVAVNTDGQTYPVWVDPNASTRVAKTLLTAGLGCKEVGPTVIRNANTEDALINVKPYIGAYGKIYTKNDKVVAIDKVESTFLTGKVLSSDVKKFEVGDAKYTYSDGFATPGAYAYFLNGKDVTASTSATLVTMGTITIAAKVEGKTIKTLYSVLKWDPTDRFMFKKTMLDSKSLNGYKFETTDDKKIDAKSFELVGVKSLDDIAADNVVYVYTEDKAANKKITRVEVGTEVVKGQITQYVSADEKYMIDGKAYGLAEGISPLKVGDKGTAYLDVNGDIFKFDATSGLADNYAVLMAKGTGTYGDPNVKLFNKAGEVKSYVVKDGVTTAGFAANELITYELSSGGQVSEMTNAGMNVALAGQFNKAGTIFAGKAVDTNAVVFVKDGRDYSLGKVSDVKKETNMTMPAFAMKDGQIKAFIVEKGVVGSNDVYGVINAVDTAVNADGDKIQKVKMLVGKESKVYDTKEPNAVPDALATTVALVKASVDSNGVITGQFIVKGADVNYNDVISINTGNNTIQMTIGAIATWYALEPNVAIYKYNTTNKEWESLSFAEGNFKNVKAELYKTDSKLSGYDIVLVKNI